LAHKVKSPM